jgi:hypothetical protein
MSGSQPIEETAGELMGRIQLRLRHVLQAIKQADGASAAAAPRLPSVSEEKEH